MGSEIYDILEPYEDEVLFSWVVRMLRLYSPTEKLTYTDEYLKFLFGPDTSTYPGLYWQRGLDYFVENVRLPNSRWFKSEKEMIENLSILPFYFCFLDDTSKQTVYEKMSLYKVYRVVNILIGIMPQKDIYEGKIYLKYCSHCLKEQPEIYLKKEHQIPGNVICCKHKCILHRVPYGQSWKDIDFPTSICNGRNVSLYELEEEDFPKALCIAEMIHNIFNNGFQDDISVLKGKIMHRLQELKIVSEKGKFYDLEGFIEVLDVDYLYKYVPIKKELISAVFISSRRVNPIIYLVLIQYLFGSLEDYYAYEYKAGSAISLKSWEMFNERVEERKHELSFYISNLPKWFEKEYVFLGETKDSIIIKHLTCGTIFKRSKRGRKFTKCRMCTESNLAAVDFKKSGSCSNGDTYFVSTSEYGQLHGKMEKQIRNYCNQNRIPGAIRVGKDILIPINAPYPDDKRIKKNK